MRDVKFTSLGRCKTVLWTSKSKENKFISQYLVERIRKSSDFEVYPSKNEYIHGTKPQNIDQQTCYTRFYWFIPDKKIIEN